MYIGSSAASLALMNSGCNSIKLSKDQKQPNVLFIAIDDLRPQLGSYGRNETVSPNIDNFVKQGIKFTRAFCQSPACGPSRSSMLSGLRPNANRFARWDARVDLDAPGIPTLPQHFKDNGYHAISNGKVFHHSDDNAQEAFSEPVFNLTHAHGNTYDPESSKFIGGIRNRGPFFESPDVPDNTYIDGVVCEKTINDLRRLKKMNTPFFLACGFVRPHLPFYAPKKYWDKYEQENIEIAKNRFRPQNAPDKLYSSSEIKFYHDRNIQYNSDEFHKVARHGYYACVSYVDSLVGKILEELGELGLRDNTIIVIWGDHGWNLGEHDFWGKDNLLYNSLNAPLIVSAPGYEADVEVNAVVEFVDIYPTLCDLVGLNQPKHLEGISLLPLLRNPKEDWKNTAFSRCLTVDGNSVGNTVITGDYSYTEYEDNEGVQQMLFDLNGDPQESVNIAMNPKYNYTIDYLSDLLNKVK